MFNYGTIFPFKNYFNNNFIIFLSCVISHNMCLPMIEYVALISFHVPFMSFHVPSMLHPFPPGSSKGDMPDMWSGEYPQKKHLRFYMMVSTNGGSPIAGWFIREIPLKWMMTGGTPMTQESTICRYCFCYMVLLSFRRPVQVSKPSGCLSSFCYSCGFLRAGNALVVLRGGPS